MARAVETVGQRLSDDSFSMREMRLDSFEQLRAATPTSNSDIIQVDAGRMQGRLKHATVAGLSLGFGTFSRGLISRGVYSNERVTIGFLFEGRPGCGDVGRLENIRVWAAGTEHERRHYGGASFGAISVSTEDLSSFFGLESCFADPSFWRNRNSFRADPLTGSAGAKALRSIMSSFESRAPALSQKHAEFWKHAILEAATAAIANTDTSEVFVSSPVRLVRRAQEIVERSGTNPVHISQLATVLRVHRRSLHRAFDEVLGISPTRYLRHRRLCEARILLRARTDPDVTVADVAFLQGFSDFGRFSRYYRSLFGENPSDTLRTARLRTP